MRVSDYLSYFRRGVLPAILCLTIVLGMGTAGHAVAASAERLLEAEIQRAAVRAGGMIGVSALHVESGRLITFQARERFPMASTYKIAIAAYAFHLAEKGALSLHQIVDVPRSKYVPSSVISHHFRHAGIKLSLLNLIEVMLTESDNTATDVILDMVGGGTAVTAWLKKSGVADIRVDRSTATLIRDFFGVAEPADKQTSALEQFENIDKNGLADFERASVTANPAFENDFRDTSTPAAMVQLLLRIWQREILNEASAETLLSIMERCATGLRRIRGRLPEGTYVADKTGSIGGTVNDVGVIALPGNRGHVLLAVLSKSETAPMAEREGAIADIARTIHDYFLFSTD